MDRILGIICAMEEELEPLMDGFDMSRTVPKAGMEFLHGYLNGLESVLVVSGIGKVNAAICTQILIDDFKVSHVINVGVAGGIGKDIAPLDVVIATSLIQHDFDVTPLGYAKGVIPRLEASEFKCDEHLSALAFDSATCCGDHKTHKGIIVTGDQFMSDSEKIRELERTFGAAACEMEGAAVAQACSLNNIPFTVVRSISDNANTGAGMDYEKFKPHAVRNSANIILKMAAALKAN